MADNKENFSHSATILSVSNMQDSLSFYSDKLGFNINFTWKDPVEYAVLKRGNVNVHLSLHNADVTNNGLHTNLYVFVYDVDGLYQDFVNKGVSKISKPETHDYGMRDFDVRDPDGHVLCFGRGTE